GLAGCPQPTNGGDINPNDKPTTHTVNNAGYDLVIPKPEIGWSQTRVQNEVNKIMPFLKKQADDLLKVSQNAPVGGVAANANYALYDIINTAYEQEGDGRMENHFNLALKDFSIFCLTPVIGSNNVKQLNAFRMGTRTEQQNFMYKTGENTAAESIIGKQNAQNAFNGLIAELRQLGITLPQGNDYATILPKLRENLVNAIPDASPTFAADRVFLNNFLQMVEDFEQFIGFTTNLGGLGKNAQLQAQAANKSNVKIAS
ncbi:MAG: hypothetical protein LBQ69_02315, partial [Treponema sp.]|nr:hypothetical protein [Treponema sp.]